MYKAVIFDFDYTLGDSTKYHYRIEQILEKNNAMNVIDVIIGGDDVKNEKPERGRGFRGGIDRNDREGRVYEL